MLAVSPPNSIRGACFLRQWRFTMCVCNLATSRFNLRSEPEEVPAPWVRSFLPNRVYLEKIESEQANIIGRFRGDERFFGTQLFITPNGGTSSTLQWAVD